MNAWIFPLVVLGYAVFWVVLCGLIAVLGGWYRLARRFPAPREPTRQGKLLRGQSISIGVCNYNGCIQLGIREEGLYVACWPIAIFLFHRPFLLPWSELEVVRIREGWLLRQIIVDVGHPPIARVTLPLRVLHEASQLRGPTTEAEGSEHVHVE